MITYGGSQQVAFYIMTKERFYSMLSMIDRDYCTRFSIFTVDTVDELDKLPRIGTKGQDNLRNVDDCCAGSRATVTETSERYVLNGNQNKWIKITSPSGGGGGSESWATEEDIDKMFP